MTTLAQYAHKAKVERLAFELKVRNSALSDEEAMHNALEMFEDQHVLDIAELHHQPDPQYCEFDDWNRT